ncbi:VCBS repeat-containing protein [Streptomyces sp. NPDC006553]|uniref:FG-GAP repeat domain-containing protein n=1 Tax=Streptomyces sp. NPDC006553 TaxID=3157180 RepID=UPI0033AE17D2
MRHITTSRRHIVAAVTTVLGLAMMSATAATAAPAPVTPVTWHDFNGNGMPDIILDSYPHSAVLRIDTTYDPATSTVTSASSEPTNLDYDTLSRSYNVATGNLGGSAVGDFVSRDCQGVLHLRKGRGDGTFTAPLRVGTGWKTYGHLVGGSDITGDGKPDLLGVARSTGELWLHTGTGKDTAPFLTTRKNLGKGWGVYHSIAGVGNIAGAPAGDVVALDANGTAWLHLGKGDGTFAPRTRISAGWAYNINFFGIGDINRDGRPDIASKSLWDTRVTVKVHLGTGDWRAPFQNTSQDLGVWGSDATPYTPRPF